MTNATQSPPTRSLLVELLVQELPPKSLKKLGDSFAETVMASLKKQGLAANDVAATPFASPRRLAVHIERVAAQAADKSFSQKLMPVTVGLDANGEATPALLKKLRSLCGEAACPPVSQLKRAVDGKAEAFFLDSVAKGVTLAEGLQKALDEALEKLPIATKMTYQLGDGWSTVNFVRPAQGLVALHGAEIVPIEVLGLTAGRKTQGHRFESKMSPLILQDADSYAQHLEAEGAVIAAFPARREEIERQLKAAASKENLDLIEDDALLDEVTALVERPHVLVGQFDPGFLDVPQECLILTMKVHQKYFPLLGKNGALSHKFLIVSNIHPADTGQIIAGNERVLRSRLADAKFFFNQDRKKTLASRVAGLDKVVYHNKLGTQAERVERISAIARAIGFQLGGNKLAEKAGEAGMLCKADLLTDMVGEFPELQGIMGGYYARHDELADDIADAIEDHYKPRFAGDELPRNMIGICVALSDKLETLVGMFSIRNFPTGDKDPFALRRNALGVVRILEKKASKLDLPWVIEESMKAFPMGSFTYEGHLALKQHLMEFFFDRLASSLHERGYSTQEIDSVLALHPGNLSDVSKRLDAVRVFSTLPEAESLAATNKRVGNILKKAGVSLGDVVIGELLQAPAEHVLHQALSRIVPVADAAFAAGDYNASLQILAALKQPVDDFFDNVMVNTEDEALRHNRLTLLAQLHRAMNRVADISRLAT